MKYETLLYLIKQNSNQYTIMIDSWLTEMSDTEFEKIPTVEMSEEEFRTTEKYGYVFAPMRNDQDGNLRIYSHGYTPFKIKVK